MISCSKKTRKKISQSMTGRRHSKKSKERMSEAKRGEKCYWFGKHHSEETKRKMSRIKKGKIPISFKLLHTKEVHDKISKSMLGIKRSEETKKRIGDANRGEKGSNWQGGKSFEPYGTEFNNNLKEIVRNRYERKCFICKKTELENKERLSVHHINYDKKNNKIDNLISLCKICHLKTNYRRKHWMSYFKTKL